MDNFSVFVRVLQLLTLSLLGIATAIAPLVWVARTILAPIDRAARSRVAPVSFSIGDFLCLFLAIQLPLAIIYRFVGDGTEGPYWTLTAITWVVAPLIWYACARTLSKAQVTNGRDRVVFLGLIMPLVYYGVIPFVGLGIAIFSSVTKGFPISIRWHLVAWLALALLFYVSGRFVRSMLNRGRSHASPVAVQDSSVATAVPQSQGSV